MIGEIQEYRNQLMFMLKMFVNQASMICYPADVHGQV
jgi:hypothetical protein